MAQSTPSLPFTESLTLKPLQNDTFETVHNPERMGNALNIAYGGFALAVSVKASASTVPSNYHLYSILGNYLGPAFTDRPLRASVRTIRQTRTFATRQVEVSQKQDDGKDRVCLVAIADFQTPEEASLLEYTIQPSQTYRSYEDVSDGRTQARKLVEERKVREGMDDAHAKAFGPLGRFFELRPCPEGIFSQNLTGMAKSLSTTQDGLPITEKSTADWIRSKESINSASENVALLAFYMDSALSFAPLSFSKMFLDDAAACSSLDFAMRVFSNRVDMGRWHLREIQTKVGSVGRTYNEALIWEEVDGELRCVASMTQANILRPHKQKKAGKL